ANSRIGTAGSVVLERTCADGRVDIASRVVLKGKSAESAVITSCIVKNQRVGSDGGVLCAAGVQQKRRRPQRSIGIPIVERQRSAANGSIEVSGAITKERIPTNA